MIAVVTKTAWLQWFNLLPLLVFESSKIGLAHPNSMSTGLFHGLVYQSVIGVKIPGLSNSLG
ncbi:hypothetical protein ACQPZ2_03165 [Nocardia pseudovaccinii]|uniref:hypothetical protein n=1 Tax=Nocardia pseudovaccinii TaxID=189540 RepID=UPI003D8C3F1E